MPHSNKRFRYHGRAPLLITLVVCLISVPAIVGWERSNARATREMENRNMAAMPELRLLRKNAPEYIKAMDAYLKDTVGFRLQANALYRKLRYFVFRDPPMPNVTLGSDGHTFFNSPRVELPNRYLQALCQEQGKPTAELLQAVDATLAQATAFFDRRGAETILAIAPSTVALYPEKLPLRVGREYRQACLAYPNSNHLLAQLEQRSAEDGRYRIFYPLALFSEHKNEIGFYPKERYHWIGKSTYLFSRHLALASGAVQTLQVNDPAHLAPVLDDLNGFFGFYRPVQGYVYPYSDRPAEETRGTWIREFSTRGSLTEFRTQNSLSSKKALLIANSFGTLLAPHLARCFGEFYYLGTNSIQPEEQEAVFAAVTERLRPDYVFLVFDDVNVVNLPQWLAGFSTLDQLDRQGSKGKFREKSGQ